MIDDLKETFDNLRVYKMMLNPAKCVFGMPAGKLLGFLVSERGIEANQEKTTFITPFAAFYYVSMPFRLKSAQETYQRCVQNCLHG